MKQALRVVRIVAAWLPVAVVAQTQPSASTSLPSPERFFERAAYSNVTLAPDGRLLAALIPINGHSNVALVDLEHKTAIALTGQDQDDVVDYRWLGSRVIEAWTADVNEASGGYRYHQHYLIDVADKVVLRDLQKISRYGAARVLGAFEPDGVDLIIETVDRTRYAYDAYRFNARTGSKQLLTFESPGDVSNFVADHAGQLRFAVSKPDGGERTVVSYRKTNDDKWTVIRDEAVGSETFVPLDFDYDNRTAYVGVPSRENGDRQDVYAYDTETGQLGARVFTAKTVDPGGVVLDRVKHRAVGVEDDSDAGVAWFDPQWQQVQRSVDQALPRAHNRLRWGLDNTDRIVIASETDTSPAEFYLLDRRTMSMERVASARPALDAASLSPRTAVVYRARDGLPIPAYLTMPKHPDGARPPLIVDIHGGPFVHGARFGYDADAQYLASRGYAVLQPNFRGTVGYGEAFEKAGWRQWGLAMQDDVTDGVKWLIANGSVDGDRVCLYGASYGGYATLWGLEKEPQMFRCGVAYLAVSDLELLIDVTWSDTMQSERDGSATKYYSRTVGDPDQDRDKLRALSPDRHADRIQAPLLLVYGATDRRVPIIHGDRMRSALDAARKPYDWVVYADQQHTVFGPENRADFYGRVDAFLAKSLAPRPSAATAASTSSETRSPVAATR